MCVCMYMCMYNRVLYRFTESDGLIAMDRVGEREWRQNKTKKKFDFDLI